MYWRTSVSFVTSLEYVLNIRYTFLVHNIIYHQVFSGLRWKHITGFLTMVIQILPSLGNYTSLVNAEVYNLRKFSLWKGTTANVQWGLQWSSICDIRSNMLSSAAHGSCIVIILVCRWLEMTQC
jgi:hypothetical protein